MGWAARYSVDEDALDHLVRLAGGDARRSLTYLEAAAGAASSRGSDAIDLETAETAVDQAAVRYDRQGDQHYDVTSAFIKSVRGSDVDAALHYLARMIEAGEDPRFIARRLVILASEDIGLADPTALTTAVAAAQAVQLIGMPEARLNLAQATIALAVAPKSNAVITAIEAASADVRAGKIGPVPPHLRDAHYRGAKKLGHGATYSTATTRRTASRSSSTPPTWSPTPSTTGRPRWAPRRRSRSAGSGSAGSSAVQDRPGGRGTRDRVGAPCRTGSCPPPCRCAGPARRGPRVRCSGACASRTARELAGRPRRGRRRCAPQSTTSSAGSPPRRPRRGPAGHRVRHHPPR